MPATNADIAAGIREATVVTWSSATIAARYSSARDGSISPSPAYFDSPIAAQTVADARGALVGTERRRFAVPVADVQWPDLTSGVPTVQLIDAEQVVNVPALLMRIELDLEAETTTFEVFG